MPERYNGFWNRDLNLICINKDLLHLCLFININLLIFKGFGFIYNMSKSQVIAYVDND